MKIGHIALVASIVIVSAWIAIYFVPLPDTREATAISEKYDALNTLFSGLALTGIIVTVLLQRNELRLQRKELEETRSELKRTANAQERSEQALHRQAANLKQSARLAAMNTMVTHLNEEIERVHYSKRDQIISKRNVFLDKIEEILSAKDPDE